YNKKIAIVYDEQADMVITGELGLRFIGHKMYKAKLIIQLHKENKLNQLLNPELIEKNKEYSKFCVSDENIIKACSELINEDYINKLVERINHNTQFLEELLNLKENLDPSDPNFGESFLTLETAINEIGDKIRKLRNLLEFGDSDLNSTY
ncbi:MAG: hypothetical protein HWN67_04990, partial [Candidatus Helarchaeota archaeon]|nr:hypothetical protein [Candidatus Helarchaeota archaeon]